MSRSKRKATRANSRVKKTPAKSRDFLDGQRDGRERAVDEAFAAAEERRLELLSDLDDVEAVIVATDRVLYTDDKAGHAVCLMAVALREMRRLKTVAEALSEEMSKASQILRGAGGDQ